MVAGLRIPHSGLRGDRSARMIRLPYNREASTSANESPSTSAAAFASDMQNLSEENG